MNRIKIHDKEFELYINKRQIQAVIQKLAIQINTDYSNDIPIIIPILNGSFIFASDLLRELTIECEVSFMKVASYSGTSSTGEVKQLIGLKENIKGRKILILEDIIDTGTTLVKIIKNLESFYPSEIKTVSLLFKPECCVNKVKIDYIGIEVLNAFLVGYGLDYNELGRNLQDIYKAIN